MTNTFVCGLGGVTCTWPLLTGLFLCFASDQVLGQDYTVLHSFTGTDGWPNAGVVQGAEGTLYGTTAGGPGGAGVIFRLGQDGSGFEVLKTFVRSEGADLNTLILSGETLYGSTGSGGAYNYGTVFKIKTNGSDFLILKEFSGLDGRAPGRLLLEESTARLFGTTRYGGVTGSGGALGYGTLFRLWTNGMGFGTLWNFNSSFSEAANPEGPLLLDGQRLYGASEYGGLHNTGTVFAINTDGSGMTLLKSFSGEDGYSPSPLVGSGAYLYGTTPHGGKPDAGTVFRLGTDGSRFETIYEFASAELGGPTGQMVPIGTTLFGVTFPYGGTIFRVNMDGTGFATVKRYMGNATNGVNPTSPLLLSWNMLYGTTRYGGDSVNYGTVFSLRLPPPELLSQPQSQTAESGSTVRFTVRAAGLEPMGYRWLCNNVESGTNNNPFLVLTNVQATDAGTYAVVVTSPVGAVTSSVAFLSVIAPVERRPVPALHLAGEAGVPLHLDYADDLILPPPWPSLTTLDGTGGTQFYFDVAATSSVQRYYRTWQPSPVTNNPGLNLTLVPALTLQGPIGSTLRVDAINVYGPTNAWQTLKTVVLTNSPQLYFDISAPGQPARLYRLVRVP